VTASRSLTSALYEGALVRGLLSAGPSSHAVSRLTGNRDPLIMPAETRTGDTAQASGFKSESCPASFRNGGRLQIGIRGRIRRNPQTRSLDGKFLPNQRDSEGKVVAQLRITFDALLVRAGQRHRKGDIYVFAIR